MTSVSDLDAGRRLRGFLDGDRVAVHEGMFVPLVVEVTGRLEPGEHTLAVVVEPAPPVG